MTYEDVERTIWDVARRESKRWLTGQTKDIYAAYYLYYRPSDKGTKFDVMVSPEEVPPGEYILADPRRISIAWTERETARFIHDVMRTLPIC